MNTDLDLKTRIAAAIGDNAALQAIYAHVQNLESGVIESLLAVASGAESHETIELRYSAWLALKIIAPDHHIAILRMILENLVPAMNQNIKIVALDICFSIMRGEASIDEGSVCELLQRLYVLGTVMCIKVRVGISKLLSVVVEKYAFLIRNLTIRPHIVPVVGRLIRTPRDCIIYFCLQCLNFMIKYNEPDLLDYIVHSNSSRRFLNFVSSSNITVAYEALQFTKFFLKNESQIVHILQNGILSHLSSLQHKRLFIDEISGVISTICNSNIPFVFPHYNIMILKMLFIFLRLSNPQIAYTSITQIFLKMPVIYIVNTITHISAAMYFFVAFTSHGNAFRLDLLRAYVELIKRIPAEQKFVAASIMNRSGALADLADLATDQSQEVSNIVFETYDEFSRIAIPPAG